MAVLIGPITHYKKWSMVPREKIKTKFLVTGLLHFCGQVSTAHAVAKKAYRLDFRHLF